MIRNAKFTDIILQRCNGSGQHHNKIVAIGALVKSQMDSIGTLRCRSPHRDAKSTLESELANLGQKIRGWEIELRGIVAEIAFVAQDAGFWTFW